MSEKESIGVEDMRGSREPTLSAEMWAEESKVMKAFRRERTQSAIA